MADPMRDLPFAKWQGCGNDYLFVDLRGAGPERVDSVVERAPELSRAWSHRRFGIGADGLVLLLSEPEADMRLAMWNADGSRGAICGTALRCATSLLALERGGGALHLRLASDVGFHSTRIERGDTGDWLPSVEMGAPSFDALSIPFDPERAPVVGGGGDRPFLVRVPLARTEVDGAVLSLGNPHLIVDAPSALEALDLEQLGPPLEGADCFPDRANVSFVQVQGPSEIALRTFERGSAETLACGSGACSAVVALTAAGKLERDAQITARMPGGALGVRWTSDGEVWLSGPTRRVFTGRAPLPS